MEIKKDYQGELAEVIYRTGKKRFIHVYRNSSDFPQYEIILMISDGDGHLPERIPINEDIWRMIGKALGYRFVLRKKEKDGK